MPPRIANWQIAAVLTVAAWPLLVLYITNQHRDQTDAPCRALGGINCPEPDAPWLAIGVITVLLVAVGLPVLTAVVAWAREQLG